MSRKRKLVTAGAIGLVLLLLIFLCRLPAPLVFSDFRLADGQEIRVRIDCGEEDQPIMFTITEAEEAAILIEMLSSLRLTPLSLSRIVSYGETGIIDLWIGESHLRLNDLGDVHSDTIRFCASREKLAAIVGRLIAAQS